VLTNEAMTTTKVTKRMSNTMKQKHTELTFKHRSTYNNRRVTAMRKWGVKGRMKVMIRFHIINVLTDHHRKLKYEYLQNKTQTMAFRKWK